MINFRYLKCYYDILEWFIWMKYLCGGERAFVKVMVGHLGMIFSNIRKTLNILFNVILESL